ncbi:MAG: type II toxin-antitoxin system ParD family antitoxin [SAR202 cluster bacterium]|nr:type II toxin-antitoxin system ParD family antitoxin [SAR202 cluster bacterium]
MNVSLTPQLEEFVKQKLKTGMYLSASEVIREALRLLEERDRRRELGLEVLRREIQTGVDQLEHGLFVEYDEQDLHNFFEDVRGEGKKSLEGGKTGD